MVIRTLLALGFVVGCGAEIGDAPDEATGDDKGDDGSSALTPTQFFTKIGNQYCDECFRCKDTYPDGPSAFATDFGMTPQQCYAGAAAFYMPQAIEQSVRAGRIAYDERSARRCADGIEYEQSCNRFWDQAPDEPDDCAAVFIGRVPDGGACTIDYDCASRTGRCDPASKRCLR